MPKGERKFVFFIAFMLLGLLIAVQGRSIFTANKEKSQAALNIDKLTVQLDEEKNKEKLLRQQINEKEKINDKYLKENVDSKNNLLLKGLKTELDSLKIKTGLTDVKGKGVIVMVSDNNERTSDNAMDNIVHDEDVLVVLNQLKSAGAQAISINGERFIAISEIVCAGPTIRINKRRTPAPFEIKAIGNPDSLSDSIKNNMYLSELRGFINIEVTKSQNISIPKYSGNLENYATSMEVLN